jgi:hypothetical protein
MVNISLAHLDEGGKILVGRMASAVAATPLPTDANLPGVGSSWLGALRGRLVIPLFSNHGFLPYLRNLVCSIERVGVTSW